MISRGVKARSRRPLTTALLSLLLFACGEEKGKRKTRKGQKPLVALGAVTQGTYPKQSIQGDSPIVTDRCEDRKLEWSREANAYR